MSAIPPLNASQVARAAAIGAVLWLAAALLLRALEPLAPLSGSTRLLTYALVVPGTWPAVLGFAPLAGLTRRQLGLGYAVGTAAATLLDGLALAWTPWLYGRDPLYVGAAGAVILWGAGVGLALALWRARD